MRLIDILALEVIMRSEQSRLSDETIVVCGGEGTSIIDTGTLHGTGFNQLILDELVIPEPWVVTWDEKWREPLPRPPKTKLKIHRAPQQSFRSRMRSVNRNR